MAEPKLDIDLLGTNDGVITFENGHVTIAAEVHFDDAHESITVESVRLENPHGSVDLPITDLVVPTPVAEHLFELLPPI